MKRVMSIVCLLALGSMFLLSSCFYPEKFQIKINIDKNGDYSFSYDGTLFYLTEEDDKEKIVLNDKDEQTIKKLEVIMRKDSSFQEIKYLGNSRFKVIYKKEGRTKEGMAFFQENSIINIEPVALDVVIIKAGPMGKELADVFKKHNIKLEGTISVTTNATVIQHNATTTPPFFGFSGAYGWQIKPDDLPHPVMILKVSQ